MKKLNKLSIVGYGAGDAANNLAFTTATMFLLVYYTDVAGISAAAAGTLLLVVRIFDAFADVFAGRVVDRTYSKRFGKFRPFIMFGSIPLLLLSVATFSIPQLGESGTLLYAYVTYAALGLAYSLVNIPYGSLAGAMTQDPAERAKLGSARMIGAMLVGSALGIFVAPLIKPGANLQATFTTITLVVRRHRRGPVPLHRPDRQGAGPPRRPQRHVQAEHGHAQGQPAAADAVHELLLLPDRLPGPHLGPALLPPRRPGPAGPVPRAVHHPARPDLRAGRRSCRSWSGTFGKKRVYIFSSLLTVIGGAIVFFTPASQVWIGFTGLVISLVGVLAVNIVVWALEADTVEYGEWKTGVRTEGITYALFSFTRKTGQAVGGALAAYALALGGYKSGAVQTARRRLRHPARRRRAAGRHDHPGRARHGQVHAYRCHARPDPHRDPGPPHRRRRHPAAADGRPALPTAAVPAAVSAGAAPLAPGN